MDEEAIKKIYGNVSLTSAPIDVENPDYNSLLGVLEAVHTNKEPMSVLYIYYEALSSKNDKNKENLSEILKTNPPNADQLRITRTVLDFISVMLDAIKKYIDDPSDENMAEALNLLLITMDKVSKVMGVLEDMK